MHVRKLLHTFLLAVNVQIFVVKIVGIQLHTTFLHAEVDIGDFLLQLAAIETGNSWHFSDSSNGVGSSTHIVFLGLVVGWWPR